MAQTFRADGAVVFINPKETKHDDGSKSISLGAAICEVNEYMTDREGIAKWIAEKLNQGTKS